jgi:RsiW-degrading membrane proteinase PrsW (M82 family)
MQENLIFVLSFFGGLVPALFWVWFWLREDKTHPEPRSLIAATFLTGMAIVPIVLPLQKFALYRFSGDSLILVWVVIEEIIKYSAALAVILWNKAVDEPIDPLIYMITLALGFSALENALFIYTPLHNGNWAQRCFMFFPLGRWVPLWHSLSTVGESSVLSWHHLGYASLSYCMHSSTLL